MNEDQGIETAMRSFKRWFVGIGLAILVCQATFTWVIVEQYSRTASVSEASVMMHAHEVELWVSLSKDANAWVEANPDAKKLVEAIERRDAESAFQLLGDLALENGITHSVRTYFENQVLAIPPKYR